MTAAAWADPIPVAWWVVALAVGILCLGFYVLGGEHTKRDEDWRIKRVVQTNRHHATLFRLLFEELQLLMPEMVPEPRPGPSRRQRLGRWIGRVWAGLQRLQRPTVLGPQPVDEAEEGEEQDGPDEANAQVSLEEQPDPEPATDPRGFPPLPGPETQPSQAVIADDWKVRSEQMLAEARAAIDAIGGKR